jgi:hypothetical protein
MSRGEYCIALFDIETAAVTDRPQSQVVDLDRPGAPPVCRTLRDELPEGRAGYSDGVLAEGTDPVRIRRCHGHSTLLRARGEVRDVELSGGLLTWDSGHSGREGEEGEFGSSSRHGTLSSYRLSSRGRTQFTLPRLPLPTGEPHSFVGVFGYSAHTANTVFWMAVRALVFGEGGSTIGAYTVYAGHL